MMRFKRGDIVYYTGDDNIYRGKYCVLAPHAAGTKINLLMPMDVIAVKYVEEHGVTLHQRNIERFEVRYGRDLSDFLGKKIITLVGRVLALHTMYTLEELLFQLENNGTN